MTTLSFYVYNDSMSSGACVVIHFFLLPWIAVTLHCSCILLCNSLECWESELGVLFSPFLSDHSLFFER